MKNTVQLITYVDRLGGDFAGLKKLLESELGGLFGGIHLLPFFDPIDGADAGFDPADHSAVDERLGDWLDVQSLAENCSVIADLIVNHISADSQQFADVLKHDESSVWWKLFIKKNDVFPESTDDIEKIYRPRPGSPFTSIKLDNGVSKEFWTTFGENQLDIDVESAEGQQYLNSILKRFADAGIQEIRLDAAGYAIKRRGTSCFMLPETFDFISSLSASAADLGMQTLVEIHSYYQTQIDIASRVGRVYDFALPPLVLHTMFSSDATALKHWLEIAPRNCVTVLDTHDGIGIMDVARDGDRAGLVTDSEVEELVEQIHVRTNGQSRLASGHAASNLDIYQVNTTFYDALGRADNLYLLARAIQFFAPGVPQVYYVGLLAGENDTQLLKDTGVGRDINRHYYSADDLHASMQKPVVQSLLAMIKLRNSASGFGGEFDMPECADSELHMRWQMADDSVELLVDLNKAVGKITQFENGVISQYTISDTFRGPITGNT